MKKIRALTAACLAVLCMAFSVSAFGAATVNETFKSGAVYTGFIPEDRFETTAQSREPETTQAPPEGFYLKNSTIITTACIIGAVCITVMLVMAIGTKKEHPSDKKHDENLKKM